MKKTIAFILAVSLLLCLSVTAFAKGSDDGTLTVADQGGNKFFGTEITANLTKYQAANGGGTVFYDISADKTMNVCDLVALHNKSVDFDLSGSFDADDAKNFRQLLLDGSN